MSKRKDVIRVGDDVRVINPEVVLRIGYPFDKELMKSKVIDSEKKNMIHRLLGYDAFMFDPFLKRMYDKSYDAILDEVAYFELHKRKFGGSERKIFTESRPDIDGKVFRVVKKSVAQTGVYTQCKYYSDDDFDPPHLSQRKDHIILTLHGMTFNQDFQIEVKNVEKIASTETCPA